MQIDKPIQLNDLLHISEKELHRYDYRIRLTFQWGKGEMDDPIAVYKRNPEDIVKHLLCFRSRNPFHVGQRIIGMIKIQGSQWLLSRVVEITEVLPGPNDGLEYKHKDVEEYRGFFGRVILQYDNPPGAQAEVRRAHALLPKIKVLSVRATGYGDEGFPGYSNVTLSWRKLTEIINRNYESWHSALSNMKGVYLIVDKTNGAAYVGKADSQNGGFWARWSSYSKTGHGGNVELKKLEFDHIQNHLQWSIVEVMDSKAQDNYINTRETWWKCALSTRGGADFNRN